jgi:hypothetical protein
VSEFEFYSVAISIVLALALGKLVSSIPSVFSRTRFDWVFGLFYVVALLGALLHWKQVWKLHDHPSWSMIAFGLLMAPSIALYLLRDPAEARAICERIARSYRRLWIRRAAP